MFKEFDERLLLSNSKFIKQKEYWSLKLLGDTEKTNLLLDNKNSRHQPLQKEMESVDFLIDRQLYEPLMKLSKKSDLSLYMVLVAILKILIHRYTGNEDIIVISPIFLTNISEDTLNDYLFIRNTINSGKTFIDLLLSLRQTVLEAYEHQDYPFDELINYLFHEEDSAGEIIISNVLCLLRNIHDDNMVKEAVEDKHTLVFYFEREEESIKSRILFNPYMYERFYLQKMTGHFLHLLETVLPNVRKRISDIYLLPEGERQQLLVEFNNTDAAFPVDKPVHKLFQLQAEKNPDNIALVHDDIENGFCTAISYGKLNNRANHLAVVLRQKGVGPDRIAAIMAEDSDRMITGMLAILMAGGAYLPIDPDYPAERKKVVLEDSGSAILLTQDLYFDGSREETRVFASDHVDCINVDDETLYSGKETNLGSVDKTGDLMYVLYTSGSTGKPKGVMVEHQNALNVLSWFGKQFNLQRYTHLLQLSDYFFDPSLEDIFGSLIHGATLFTGARGLVGDRELFYRFVNRNQIHIINYVPGLLKELLCHEKILKSLQVIISGGERLEDCVKDQILERGYNLYNNYGPTEITVDALVELCSEKRVTLGKPIANTRCYILDNQNQLVPVGGIGELCIAGCGVSRGYLNNPELTVDRFVENPHVPKERMYKTGDLARWTYDGSIVFLGRIDHQVKIRGYRIELGEIENQLLNHPEIKEAVVVPKERDTSDTHLCAYFVPASSYSPTPTHPLDFSVVHHLREYLAEKLPNYMVPSYLIPLKAIPRTTIGKVNRRALPEPEIFVNGEAYEAPRNDIEKKLVEIWSEILGIEKDIIGIDNNFFELGGHSLKATILVSKIHKMFNIKLPLVKAFGSPTIRELSEHIGTTTEDKYVPLEPVEEREYYRLSSAQKRMYIVQQLGVEDTVYNIPDIITLDPAVYNRAELEQTFRQLIGRHEILRTSFQLIDGEPVQEVHESVEFSIEYHELSITQAEAEAEAEVNVESKVEEGTPHSLHIPYSPRHIIKSFIRPFDLSKAPLLRVGLIEMGENKLFLMMDIHHIIADSVSYGILVEDFKALVEGKELPPLKLQYKDFSEWQNRMFESGKIKKQEEYWLKVFEGEIPTLDIPTDFDRVKDSGFEGDKISFFIDKEETGALKQLALSEEVTLFMVLIALFNLLLSKLSSQEDILVGIPIACRKHADLHHIMGMFVNTLVLRNHPRREMTFQEFLQEVKKNTLEAFENQDYPFEELVDKLLLHRDITHNPLFDVVFALQNAEYEYQNQMKEVPETRNILETKTRFYEFEHRVSHFDLIFDGREREDKLHFTVLYKTKLFKKERVEQFINYFKEIVASVIEKPRLRLEDIKVTHALNTAKPNVSLMGLEF
jgi:amino acid adenylation domain-containing protein